MDEHMILIIYGEDILIDSLKLSKNDRRHFLNINKNICEEDIYFDILVPNLVYNKFIEKTNSEKYNDKDMIYYIDIMKDVLWNKVSLGIVDENLSFEDKLKLYLKNIKRNYKHIIYVKGGEIDKDFKDFCNNRLGVGIESFTLNNFIRVYKEVYSMEEYGEIPGLNMNDKEIKDVMDTLEGIRIMQDILYVQYFDIEIMIDRMKKIDMRRLMDSERMLKSLKREAKEIDKTLKGALLGDYDPILLNKIPEQLEPIVGYPPTNVEDNTIGVGDKMIYIKLKNDSLLEKIDYMEDAIYNIKNKNK